MIMMFRTAKAAIEAILAGYATSGGYRVLGYNEDAIDAADLSGVRRLVQVYADGGDFPRANSPFTGPAKHAVSFSVVLMSAAKAQVDLSVLNDEGATEAQIIAALAASQKASEIADANLDEFVDVIFNLLMSNENINLGLNESNYRITNRWVANWKKSKPMPRGETVVLTATLDYTCQVVEEFLGVTPVAAAVGQAVRTEIDIATKEDAEPGEGLAGVLVGG